MNTDRKTHFIGIGGIGMSALAHILLQRGETVSGSDALMNPAVDSLGKEGAVISIGHSSGNIQPGMRVIFSSAVSLENPEMRQAKENGLKILHRSELLAEIMNGYDPLLVTGTHGKTTTSSLLAHVLASAGEKPGFAVGGIVKSLHSNGGHGEGRYFVAEADESDGTFLNYSPYGAIVTNINNDHMDYWKSEAELNAAFQQFALQVKSKERLFWCADDPRLASLGLPGKKYGFSPRADVQITQACQEGWHVVFSLNIRGVEYADIEASLIGTHNVLNAAAVFGLCLALGVPEDSIRDAFISFEGIGRRVEKKGEAKTISIYDDYAHHPTEIMTTLKALKEVFAGKRLVVAFQPHRYTRTRDCLNQFPEAFAEADALILADIYSAGEAPIEGVTNEVLLEKIRNKIKEKVNFVPRQQMVSFLSEFLKPNDILVTMGAGDVTRIGPDLLAFLSE